MKIFEYTEDINVDTAHISDELSDILYFDIETTGLSAKRSDLYLIGCSYFSDSAFRTTELQSLKCCPILNRS